MKCHRWFLVVGLAAALTGTACRSRVRIDTCDAVVHLTVFDAGKTANKDLTTTVKLYSAREWLGCTCDGALDVIFEAGTLPDQHERIGEVLPIHRDQGTWKLECEWSPPAKSEYRERYLGSGKIEADQLEGKWDAYYLWKPKPERHIYSASLTAKKTSTERRAVY